MKHEISRFRAMALAAACAALFASLFLSGCGSMPTYATSFPDEPIASPENSSIYYGWACQMGFDSMVFAQMNTKLPPVNLKTMLYMDWWVTKPVHPGERYKLIHTSGANGVTEYSLDQTTEVDFTVPNEPGLHFMGFQATQGYIIPCTLEQGEIYCLNFMLSMYKDTVWEPVIQKRKEELENAQKKQN